MQDNFLWNANVDRIKNTSKGGKVRGAAIVRIAIEILEVIVMTRVVFRIRIWTAPSCKGLEWWYLLLNQRSIMSIPKQPPPFFYQSCRLLYLISQPFRKDSKQNFRVARIISPNGSAFPMGFKKPGHPFENYPTGEFTTSPIQYRVLGYRSKPTYQNPATRTQSWHCTNRSSNAPHRSMIHSFGIAQSGSKAFPGTRGPR